MADVRAEALRRIEDNLLGLRTRLRLRVALLGGLETLGIALGAGVLLFALDRAFTPPAPVRLILLGLTLLLLGLTLWRLLIRPLGLSLGPDEMALALERRFPRLSQQLISAVQLGRSDTAPGNSQALISALLDRARTSVDELAADRIFENRRAPRAALALVFLAGVAGIGWATAPADVSAWARRMLGMNVRYPRATLLSIVLPESSPFFQITGDRILAARGADLPVAVHVQGRIPDTVFLVLDDGSEQALAPKDARNFRHTFRSIASPFAFFARGGDDPQGDRKITVRVIEAPAVASIRGEVMPPAYTREEPRVQEGGPLEGLPGSAVTLQVRTTQPIRLATLAFDSGPEQPFQAGPGGVLEASFFIERPDRYRVLLEGEMGLSSVRPGSYPILVLKDAPPRVTLADPAGGETVITLQGVLPLRAMCTDDFGITRAVLVLEFPDGSLAARQPLFSGGPVRRLDLVRLFSASELLTEGPRTLREGDTLQLKLEVTDNAQPEPATPPTPREHRVNLVSPSELLRTVSDHMRRQRVEVETASRTQKRLIQTLTATADTAGDLTPATRTGIQAVQGGQSRLGSVARRLARNLARGFDLYLFGGTIEPTEAEALQLRYLRHHEALDQQPDYDPRFYLMLHASQQTGEIAISPRAARVLEMIASALELESNLFPGLERVLARAGAATSGPTQASLIAEARTLQDQADQRLEELLAWLEEWSQFDDVIQVIRELHEAQRRLLDRTRTALPGIQNK